MPDAKRKAFTVPNVYFDYDARKWCPKTYELPHVDDKYIMLTPRDMLTKDENWM